MGAIIISVAEDLRRQKIPNVVTFGTMIIALVYHALTGFDGFLFSLSGLALGMALFIVPYGLGVWGAGDVKLMGAIGAVLGAQGVLIISIMTAVIGGVYGLIVLATRPRSLLSFLKRWWLTLKTFFFTRKFIPIPPDQAERQPALKYAVPIGLAAFSYMIMHFTGYDLFPDLLGIAHPMLSIGKGGTW